MGTQGRVSLQLQERLIAQGSRVGIAGYRFQPLRGRRDAARSLGPRLGGAEAGRLEFVTLGTDLLNVFCTNSPSGDYPIKLFDM